VDKEHHEEWHRLSDRARGILRASSNTDGIGINRVVQVIVMPSFAPAASWEIFAQHSRSSPTAHFAISSLWRLDLDSAKFRTPIERLKHSKMLDPTIEVRRVELEPDFVRNAVARLRQISLPAYSEPDQVGADGTSYELAFGCSFLGARFMWWETPSGPWQALAKEARLLLDELEKL
jgi:hypothetical protein